VFIVLISFGPFGQWVFVNGSIELYFRHLIYGEVLDSS